MESQKSHGRNTLFFSVILISVVTLLVLSSNINAQDNESSNETGNQTTNQSNIALPYVEPSVWEEVDSYGWVRVMVVVNDVDLLDTIISALPETDFQLLEKARIISAFSGNITRMGLEILANNPNVTSINVEHVNQAVNDNLLYPKPYIDPHIYEELAKYGSVHVLIGLRDASLIDAIIANFTPSDFQLIKKRPTTSALSANITIDALDILANDTNVTAIFVEAISHATSEENNSSPPIESSNPAKPSGVEEKPIFNKAFIASSVIFLIIIFCFLLYRILNKRPKKKET